MIDSRKSILILWQTGRDIVMNSGLTCGGQVRPLNLLDRDFMAYVSGAHSRRASCNPQWLIIQQADVNSVSPRAQSSTHFLPVQKQPSVAGMTYGGLQKESSPSREFSPLLAGLSGKRRYDSSDCRIGLPRQSGSANRAAFCHSRPVSRLRGVPVTRHHTSRRRDTPAAIAENAACHKRIVLPFSPRPVFIILPASNLVHWSSHMAGKHRRAVQKRGGEGMKVRM